MWNLPGEIRCEKEKTEAKGLVQNCSGEPRILGLPLKASLDNAEPELQCNVKSKCFLVMLFNRSYSELYHSFYLRHEG